MAVRSTQPLTKMSITNLYWNEVGQGHKADTVTLMCELIVKELWESRRLATL